MEFIDREISWIQFNGRVLQEATDLNNPIVERIKFLGIFSNNRDEFFRVRIATLRRMINLAPAASLEHLKLTKELDTLLDIVEIQEIEYTEAFKNILQELNSEKIFMLNETELNEQQGLFANSYFKNQIHPILFPIMLDYFHAGQSLIDSAIYLAVELTDTTGGQKERHVLIEVPSELPRFVRLKKQNDKYYFMFLEDIIRYNLHNLFSFWGYDKIESYIIKFTRDSELDIDNDVSKSFLEIMGESVKKRTKGIPVRFIYDKNIPENLLKKLIKKLNITTKNYQLRGGGRYHNFKDLMAFPSFRKDLTFNKLPTIKHPALIDSQSFFTKLKEQDVLLHFPYHPFGHIINFIREASVDSKVKSIKMTFYRAAKDSIAMNALINAARNGKRVTVFMELQARFDEQANILWTKKLQSEGIKVLTTIPGMKVHAKLISIRRKENNRNVFYSNISTGNFNESTAKVYSDLSLLTSNQEIGLDVYNFFELIESRYRPPQFKHSFISPFHLRDFFNDKIQREIDNKKNGKEAWIILKLNSIVDKPIARKLYTAGQAGVKTDLIIRGINIMQTGVPDFSENINAVSIVGRYLEHSRIFIFANGGNPEFYISSADIMSRNLDHRFEIIIPILDKKLQAELMTIVKFQLEDTIKYRSLNYGQVNEYTRKNKGYPALNSQIAIYNYLKKVATKAELKSAQNKKSQTR